MTRTSSLSQTQFRRRKPARTHVFVMALLVAACMAVAIWPRDRQLSTKPATAGLGSAFQSAPSSVPVD